MCLYLEFFDWKKCFTSLGDASSEEKSELETRRAAYLRFKELVEDLSSALGFEAATLKEEPSDDEEDKIAAMEVLFRCWYADLTMFRFTIILRSNELSKLMISCVKKECQLLVFTIRPRFFCFSSAIVPVIVFLMN